MNKSYNMSVLEKKTQVRFNASVKLQLAIEAYMEKKGVTKGAVIEEFLLGSKVLQKEIQNIVKLYGY